MKRLLFLILNIFFCINYGSESIFNAPDLGKTHFIVGMPPQKEIERVATVCKTDELTGLLQCKDGGLKQAFFSPDDDLETILIALINAEQRAIRAAVFSFTNGAIAQALVNAYKRGVQIEIITDISCLRDKFNKIDMLKKAGIKIFVYNPRISRSLLNNIMHNKFVLFEKNAGNKSLVWTGSFNWTKSAQVNNQENIIILDEIHIIEKYNKQFALLKQRLKGKQSTSIAQSRNRLIAKNSRTISKRDMPDSLS